MMKPGIMPPTNRREIEKPVMQPKTIISTLGGMIGPSEPAPALIAAVKPRL